MVLVFDLGGTNTRIAVAKGGRLGEVIHVPTDETAAGFARFLGALQEVAGENKIEAVAGGCSLQLKGEEGEVAVATNLPDWLGVRFRKGIEELFGCPVYVANDVEMAGLGEAHFGAGITEGVMVYYTVSTGVNAARIVDGAVDRTINRYELGYQIIDHAAGKPQSLESLVGGAALEKRLGKAPREVRDKAVWRGLERYLAAGLYNTMLYWSPATVVLGGSMMRDLEVDRVADELATMPMVHEAWPLLKLAECGDEAGIRGAMVWLSQQGHD